MAFFSLFEHNSIDRNITLYMYRSRFEFFSHKAVIVLQVHEIIVVIIKASIGKTSEKKVYSSILIMLEKLVI
jgi:hypothetical protein